MKLKLESYMEFVKPLHSCVCVLSHYISIFILSIAHNEKVTTYDAITTTETHYPEMGVRGILSTYVVHKHIVCDKNNNHRERTEKRYTQLS